jgi:hypothetical protein
LNTHVQQENPTVQISLRGPVLEPTFMWFAFGLRGLQCVQTVRRLCKPNWWWGAQQHVDRLPDWLGSRTVTNDDIARAILDAGKYVVLATADADGVPWASPVWFAKDDYRELYWVSYPGARHSQNIAVRPEVALVVFDPTVPPGTGQAVYMTATAEQLTDAAAIEHGISIFSRESLRQGGRGGVGARPGHRGSAASAVPGERA